jgi:hypothetical protein
LGEIERGLREPEPEGLDYVKVGLGLVFVFGAFVFGILSPPGTLVISFGLMIPAVALLASALQEAKKRRALFSPPANRERELLSAIRKIGGSITPAEAAMETSLTVREADRRGAPLRRERGWYAALFSSVEAGARARRTRLRNLTNVICLRLHAASGVLPCARV